MNIVLIDVFLQKFGLEIWLTSRMEGEAMSVQGGKLIDLIMTHYKKLLSLIIILFVPMSYYFVQQQYVNHVEIYFDKSDADLAFYKRFQETYGNEQQVLIVFEDDDIFNRENILTIKAITDAMEDIDGILRVFSLTNVETAKSEDGAVAFGPLFSHAFFTSGNPTLVADELNVAKKKASSRMGMLPMLISDNLKVTAVICEVADLHVEAKRELMETIMKTAENIAGNRIKLRYAGVVYLETELNYRTQKDNETITPLICLLIVLIAGFLLKNVWLSCLTLVNLIVIITLSIGLFVWRGETFNIISSMMSPILLAISVSASIHLLSQFRQEPMFGSDNKTALKNAMGHVFTACLFTTLTICIGFLSFMVSDIRPVRIFSLYTAVGIAISFVVTMTFLPGLLMILGKKIKPSAKQKRSVKDGMISISLIYISHVTIRYHRLIIALTALVFMITGIGIAKIRIETNQGRYFPETNPMKQDMDWVDHHLIGSLPINLLIRAKDEAHDFTHPQSLALMDEVKHHITNTIENISVSFAMSDYMKEAHQAFTDGSEANYAIPGNRSNIIDYYKLADEELKGRLVTSDYMEGRVAFQCQLISNEKANVLFDEIHSYLDQMLGDTYTYQITGLTKLYLKMDKKLMTTFLKSFSVAFFLIFLMMLVICRKPFLAFIAMIPNMFPIAATMGIMGWLDIPLDVATIMIASIVLGIAVDDTIHFTVRLKKNALSEPDIAHAIARTFRDVGVQLVITSLVLFFGFSLLVLGSVIPVKTFGLLTGFSMLFALFGDLIILPAVIMVFKPKL